MRRQDPLGAILGSMADEYRNVQTTRREEEDRQQRRSYTDLLMENTRDTLDDRRSTREAERAEAERRAAARAKLYERVKELYPDDPVAQASAMYAFELEEGHIPEAIEYVPPEVAARRKADETRATTTAAEEAKEPFREKAHGRNLERDARRPRSGGGGGGSGSGGASPSPGGEGMYPRMSPTQASGFLDGIVRGRVDDDGNIVELDPAAYSTLYQKATVGTLSQSDIDAALEGPKTPAPARSRTASPEAPPVPSVAPPPAREPLAPPRGSGGGGMPDDELAEARQLAREKGLNASQLRQLGFTDDQVAQILR